MAGVARLLCGSAEGMKMTEQRASLAEKENVLMSAIVLREGDCAVTFLPSFGGKISSIRIGSQELLQRPLAPIAARTRTMAFDQSDASGWDECLPSVAACTVQTPSGSAQVPDHGDVWRVEWREKPGTQASPVEGSVRRAHQTTSATLVARCFSLPLEVERRAVLSHRNGGWQLQLQYKLTNVGDYSAPWSWAAHPLFAVQRGDRIVL